MYLNQNVSENGAFDEVGHSLVLKLEKNSQNTIILHLSPSFLSFQIQNLKHSECLCDCSNRGNERWRNLFLLRYHQILRTIVFADHRLLLQHAQVLHVLEKALVRGQQFRTFHVLLQLLHVALQLCPAVLEPRYHLCVRQPEAGRDLVPIGGAQVFLVQEPFLQLEDLVIGEGRSRFSLLLRLLARVEQVQGVLAIWKKYFLL